MYTYHDHMCIVYMRNFMTICIQSIYIYIYTWWAKFLVGHLVIQMFFPAIFQ